MLAIVAAGALLTYLDNICCLQIVTVARSEYCLIPTAANFSSLHSLDPFKFSLFLFTSPLQSGPIYQHLPKLQGTSTILFILH